MNMFVFFIIVSVLKHSMHHIESFSSLYALDFCRSDPIISSSQYKIPIPDANVPTINYHQPWLFVIATVCGAVPVINNTPDLGPRRITTAEGLRPFILDTQNTNDGTTLQSLIRYLTYGKHTFELADILFYEIKNSPHATRCSASNEFVYKAHGNVYKNAYAVDVETVLFPEIRAKYELIRQTAGANIMWPSNDVSKWPSNNRVYIAPIKTFMGPHTSKRSRLYMGDLTFKTFLHEYFHDSLDHSGAVIGAFGDVPNHGNNTMFGQYFINVTGDDTCIMGYNGNAVLLNALQSWRMGIATHVGNEVRQGTHTVYVPALLFSPINHARIVVRHLYTVKDVDAQVDARKDYVYTVSYYPPATGIQYFDKSPTSVRFAGHVMVHGESPSPWSVDPNFHNVASSVLWKVLRPGDSWTSTHCSPNFTVTFVAKTEQGGVPHAQINVVMR
jgi:hypothetical protein